MAKGEGESSIAPFAGDTFALRLAHCLRGVLQTAAVALSQETVLDWVALRSMH